MTLLKRALLVVACLSVPTHVAAECQQRLGWFDKWVILPASGGAGFRDVVSTIQTMERIPTAREAGIIYRIFKIVPTENPEAFAWVRGGGTAALVITSATFLSSCRAGDRHLGRWLAIGHGIVSIWAAQHNDTIRRSLLILQAQHTQGR